MALRKVMKCQPSEILAAKGILNHDWKALTPCQRECTARLGMTMQLEQEAYLSQHPEIGALLEVFISRMDHVTKRKSDVLKDAAQFFVRPQNVLDEEVRERLGISPEDPYVKPNTSSFHFNEKYLVEDLRNIVKKHHPPEPWRIPTPDVSTPDTMSSSFMSLVTSDTTLPTPEPIPTPEPTLSEIFFALVSNTVDKAIYSHVDDPILRYDTAYVELIKAVEDAMEVPVIEIKEDIHQLFFNAYKMFEINIMEKERIAAEIAWEKRMRKKLKRTLRRENNFRGYETPPTPKSEVSSHESYLKAPPRPCKCHPQWHYNRYDKDRFGIYLPLSEQYKDTNITVTPAISLDDLDEDEADTDKCESKSICSKKSVASCKSVVISKSEADARLIATRRAMLTGKTLKIEVDTKSILSKKSAVSGKAAGKTEDTKSITSGKSAISGKSTATTGTTRTTASKGKPADRCQ